MNETKFCYLIQTLTLQGLVKKYVPFAYLVPQRTFRRSFGVLSFWFVAFFFFNEVKKD